jgi:hypothetical protein
LEFFNFITDVQSFKIIPNFWPVKFFIINIIPFILTFWYWFFIQYFLYNFNLLVFCINNKEFQWKCNHNIIYTESRLRKMNLSNGRCHLCKESNIQEDLQHMFFKCIISNRFISNITILINTLNVGTVNLNEKNMMFGFNNFYI